MIKIKESKNNLRKILEKKRIFLKQEHNDTLSRTESKTSTPEKDDKSSVHDSEPKTTMADKKALFKKKKK